MENIFENKLRDEFVSSNVWMNVVPRHPKRLRIRDGKSGCGVKNGISVFSEAFRDGLVHGCKGIGLGLVEFGNKHDDGVFRIKQ